MATASLVDYLSEKFYSLSSKMWGSSLQPTSSSFLMSGNSNLQQYDLSAVLGEVRDKIDYQIAINPTYQFLPLHRFTTGIFGGLKILSGLNKPNNYMNMTEKVFPPYLFNSVSDSYRPKCGPYDSSLVSHDSKSPNPAKESVLSESCIMSQKTDTMKKEKSFNPQVIEMTVDVNHLPTEEKCGTVKENCDITPTVRLNIELAHRKTKEMSKRSKKRRRRQKKSEQLNVSSSTSASDDEDANNECSPVTDSVCFVSKSPDFGCTLSVTQTIQFSPRNSFLIPVTSDSEDDSEWETFEKIEISAANSESSSEINSGDSSSSSNSSPIKCKSLKSSSFKPSVHVSSIISFVVPEDDSNDDDSDWDTCETSTFPENTDDFELSGLYFTTLCTPQSYYKSDCNSDFTSEADSEEKLQQRADLLEANSKWNNLDSQTPKSASKVPIVKFFVCFSSLLFLVITIFHST